MSVLKRVGMVILMQNELDKAVSFYSELGLQRVFYIPGKWAEMELAGIKIGLCPFDVAGDRRVGIVFEVEDLKKIYDEHKGQVNFLSEPYEAIHGIMVSFRDPSGNILDLYQPTPERVKDLVANVMSDDRLKDGKMECAKEDCCKKKQSLKSVECN